ncbi:hypothetical protein NXF25_005311 [Crotalus adamanteus]|uniref:Uncharacterized protein n=1 Tax=Crotalus adamanteus TaxID=8729 RepID=A0AAW1BX05_CROAD
MGSPPKSVGFQSSTQMSLLIWFVMPLLFTMVTAQLPGCTKSTTLAHRVAASRVENDKKPLFAHIRMKKYFN